MRSQKSRLPVASPTRATSRRASVASPACRLTATGWHSAGRTEAACGPTQHENSFDVGLDLLRLKVGLAGGSPDVYGTLGYGPPVLDGRMTPLMVAASADAVNWLL